MRQQIMGGWVGANYLEVAITFGAHIAKTCAETLTENEAHPHKANRVVSLVAVITYFN
jgi:hypothetical protein